MAVFDLGVAVVYLAALLYAAATDLACYRIPNLCSAVLVGLFVAARLAAPGEGAVVAQHLAVGAALFAAGIGLFFAGAWGGGDAKLFAAVGLWVGWPEVGGYLVGTALAGGALAVALLAARRVFGPVATRYATRHPAGGWCWAARLATPGQPVPYGVAIACSGVYSFLYSYSFTQYRTGTFDVLCIGKFC